MSIYKCIFAKCANIGKVLLPTVGRSNFTRILIPLAKMLYSSGGGALDDDDARSISTGPYELECRLSRMSERVEEDEGRVAVQQQQEGDEEEDKERRRPVELARPRPPSQRAWG